MKKKKLPRKIMRENRRFKKVILLYLKDAIKLNELCPGLINKKRPYKFTVGNTNFSIWNPAKLKEIVEKNFTIWHW